MVGWAIFIVIDCADTVCVPAVQIKDDSTTTDAQRNVMAEFPPCELVRRTSHESRGGDNRSTVLWTLRPSDRRLFREAMIAGGKRAP
jgi:hypothetical protein